MNRYCVEGYIKEFSVNKNLIGDVTATFKFESDWKGEKSANLYKIICSNNNCGQYDAFDDSKIFGLNFAIDGFMAKLDSHLRISFIKNSDSKTPILGANYVVENFYILD